MNLTGQNIRQKQGKPVKDRAHMERVAQLPCVICARWPVQVHHVIHDRYGSRKASDTETIPLCHNCHEDLHRSKSEWRKRHGADWEYLDWVKKMLA